MYIQYTESKKQAWVDCVQYVSSGIISKNKQFVSESPKKFLRYRQFHLDIV